VGRERGEQDRSPRPTWRRAPNLRLSDYVSAAGGANRWCSWNPGVASGLLGRDDAKDNVFAQLVVRY
jgi:hypothetical protein